MPVVHTVLLLLYSNIYTTTAVHCFFIADISYYKLYYITLSYIAIVLLLFILGLHQCKLPAQQFFQDTLGLPLTVTPNFETQECQWSWGLVPLEPSLDPSFPQGCLGNCPSRGLLKLSQQQQSNDIDGVPIISKNNKISSNLCNY